MSVCCKSVHLYLCVLRDCVSICVSLCAVIVCGCENVCATRVCECVCVPVCVHAVVCIGLEGSRSQAFPQCPLNPSDNEVQLPGTPQPCIPRPRQRGDSKSCAQL